MYNYDNIGILLREVIATDPGFGSLSSFNRAFKRNTGTTVTSYKARGLQKTSDLKKRAGEENKP